MNSGVNASIMENTFTAGWTVLCAIPLAISIAMIDRIRDSTSNGFSRNLATKEGILGNLTLLMNIF